MMDIEPLRFTYENDLFRIIKAQLGTLLHRQPSESQHLLDARRQDLLGDAVRITEDLLPEIYQHYQYCLKILGGELTGDLFVCQSKEYNASVFGHGKKFDVLIHSALLNDFTLDELCFVFGHELGHVVFEHSRVSVQEILLNTKGISADTADILFRWARAAEVSADRVGLLCCGKLTTAVNALFRTSSGLSGINVDQMLSSFRRQYEDLETQLRTGGNRLGWTRVHPMMPIRFKALELAALDIVSLRQQSKGFSWKGFRAIDRQIAAILEAIDIRTISAYFT